ncbi:AAA family ATPase [Parabacteroides sp. AF17-28]|uniref:ATP-binding protein n=1 Tax=Parabacteroides sp. AF17-28 TaxID=2292241 RepID=UPI000EFF4BD9|nr:AAA family ATPase [Parabacteroides sp. AF17-28]RHR50803.1 AAA family ATPase [Parabacteroides sp. AF17-28]
METLISIYQQLIAATQTDFVRYLYKEIDWDLRLIGITGARGTGKTTLLLQHIKLDIRDKSKALFVSLDHVWFTTHTVVDLARQFHSYGGQYLFLDEVHRYPDWAREIKNIYDSYPDLHIVFTGSSILEIYKSNADLSRRAISYHLHGLSFREYLAFEKVLNVPPVSLDEILSRHQDICMDIVGKVKILPCFKDYLKNGYYPFYKEGLKVYPIRIQNVINTILDGDLPAVEKIDYSSVMKMKKLLGIVSSLVPFTPNMTKLSSELGINRTSLSNYFSYLHKAGLLILLHPDANGMSLLNKPDKIYLNNSNILYALGGSSTNEGNVRETFFVNQLMAVHPISSSLQTDFLVGKKYSFEIGGNGKGFRQIKDLPDSYIASDDIETGFGNKIPLWLFGFLY